MYPWRKLVFFILVTTGGTSSIQVSEDLKTTAFQLSLPVESSGEDPSNPSHSPPANQNLKKPDQIHNQQMGLNHTPPPNQNLKKPDQIHNQPPNLYHNQPDQNHNHPGQDHYKPPVLNHSRPDQNSNQPSGHYSQTPGVDDTQSDVSPDGRVSQSDISPDGGVSQRVLSRPKKKKDLGVLGSVMASLLMIVILLVGSGIAVGYFYKRGRSFRRQQQQEACEREERRMNLPLSAFSNPACELVEENTGSAGGQNLPAEEGEGEEMEEMEEMEEKEVERFQVDPEGQTANPPFAPERTQ